MSKPIATTDFFAFRAPLLPFQKFLDWSDGLQGPSVGQDGDALEHALEADRTRLRDGLRKQLDDPLVREAIFLASPSLFDRLETWHSEPESKQGRKVERAIVRYFVRMAGRATPFGLFAGCAVGRIDTATHLTVPDRTTHRRHTRLDMEYVFQLAEALATSTQLRSELRFRPNSTLYRAAGRLRYAESRIVGNTRNHRLVVVDETDYLLATIERAGAGASLEALAAALVDDEITLEDAEAYLAELIDSQILVSELEPPVTGPEQISHLIEQLTPHRPVNEITQRLCELREGMSQLDHNRTANTPDAYRRLADSLQKFPVPVQLSRLFQVDLILPSDHLSLGQNVVQEMLRGVEIVRSMYRRLIDDLAEFRRDFAERYGDREIPLVEALDEESGIGFRKSPLPNVESEPLLAGILMPMGLDATMTWTHQHTELLRHFTKTIAAGKQEMRLSKADIAALAGSPDELPDAFSVKCTLAAASCEDVDRGNFQIVFGGVAGPSGARLLGRFCHIDDDLREHVTQHLRREESLQPDAVFAEIVHLPEDRMGNVLCRPVLRDYEIPYLGRSGVPEERQIPITDLFVSLRDGRIVLRSQRLNREVIPRLTSAHNFLLRTLGVYQFLGSMQHQGIEGWSAWNWGPLKYAPFLPRVTTDRLVLSRACWNLSMQEIEDLRKRSGANLYQHVQQWRESRSLPRHVLLAESDNELPIDLDNILSVETLADLVNRKNEVQLVEMFPGPEELCAAGSDGRHVHELIVPFVRTHEPRRSSVGPAKAPAADQQRVFGQGSEWCQLNLFAGSSTIDRLLVEYVRPITNTMTESSDIDSWFFLRYNVPGNHLRLRVHGDSQRLQRIVIPKLNRLSARLQSDGLVSRVQWDTYEREVERYGGMEAMPLVEQIFHADSQSAIELVANYAGDEGAHLRWQLALYGLDRLLDDLGLPLEEKLSVARDCATVFAHEFGFHGPFRKQLSQKQRDLGSQIEKLLSGERDNEPVLTAGLESYRTRSHRISPVAANLQDLSARGLLSMSVNGIARSLWHMHVNRVLRAAHRAQELILYDLLTRQYESQRARRRLNI
ncbi:MAG: lantibiotic dehydratase [Planctomycetaceae bacterium]|nr:lantibiotic dehydratase [Planctomycetaceae bacterium]